MASSLTEHRCVIFMINCTKTENGILFSFVFVCGGGGGSCFSISILESMHKEVLAIQRIFSLVDMIANTKFSNCPNVFKIGVVWQ